VEMLGCKSMAWIRNWLNDIFLGGGGDDSKTQLKHTTIH